jgi:cyclopropane fatty-acyl-phospholipid synthase-like methyltransferase
MNINDPNYLTEFFGGNHWKTPDFSRKEYDVIASEIDPTESVLDVGCGFNLLKGRLNVIGIDKYNPAADHVVDLMDYNPPGLFDVVLALGSTNIVPFSTIKQQVDRVISWCRPGGRIYMRVNPCIDRADTPENAYPWQLQEIIDITEEHGLTIIKPITLTARKRIIWTWQK